MSKELEEIIDLVERAKEYCEERCLDNAIDKLRILATPVQYVVETWTCNGIVGIDDQERTYAGIGDIFFREAHPTKIKKVCHSGLNEMAKMMGFPPIHMNQITFVEVKEQRS